MTAKDHLLHEFDQEAALTRRVLERVPESAFAWKPHEKSFAMGALATHLAKIPHWGSSILDRDGYDFAENTSSSPTVALTTPQAVLDLFDTHVAAVRRSLLDATDGTLDATWTLKRGGKTLMSMPRLAAIRRFLLNHLVHHRGQMTVYLRLHDVPLPPLYGPSADETM
jgi:uncharacterized damage-inducible protein DinB